MSAVKSKPQKQTTKFIDSVKETLPSATVLVFCKSDTLPLEWPRDPDTGLKAVSDEQVTIAPNGKIFRTNKVVYRDIVTTAPGAKRGEVGKLGYQTLDLNDTTHPTESDAAFLERIKDWLANSNDPRIHTYAVSVAQDNPFPLPFATWNDLKPRTIVETIAAAYLGDDAEENEERLRQFAGYELNRRIERKDERGNVTDVEGPRQDVLDGIELLASSSGDESDDDAEIEDES